MNDQFDKTQWHDCHLWHPVFIDGKLRWPPYAQRRWVDGKWEYRQRQPSKEEVAEEQW